MQSFANSQDFEFSHFCDHEISGLASFQRIEVSSRAKHGFQIHLKSVFHVAPSIHQAQLTAKVTILQMVGLRCP